MICPEHTADLREAIVHGVLHLLGMDHETDDGEMLALQEELLARADDVDAQRLRRARRQAERRQVDVRQRGRRREGRDRLRSSADHAPGDPRRPPAGDCQIVLVDLPGVQRPRDALTSRMARRVQQELADADAALLMLNGEQGVGPGDRFIAAPLAAAALR